MPYIIVLLPKVIYMALPVCLYIRYHLIHSDGHFTGSRLHDYIRQVSLTYKEAIHLSQLFSQFLLLTRLPSKHSIETNSNQNTSITNHSKQCVSTYSPLPSSSSLVGWR